MKNLLKLLPFFLLSCSLSLSAQFEIELEQVASGLSSPVDITHAGDDRLFIVERSASIRILNADGTLRAQDFLDINSRVVNAFGQSEQGLLGLAFHPDYANNGYFFVYYINNGGDGVLARFSVDPNDPNKADPDSEKIIMEINQPYPNHNGGGIKFGIDGYLYIGLGDGGAAEDPENRSQNPQTLLGKMLRIDIDNGDPYSIPADNPFAEEDFTLDEIWAVGVRNPWRFSFDKETHDLWMGDVGQYVWEEINFQPADSPGGENYGWRCYEGNNTFNTSGCPSADNFVEAAVDYNHQGLTHCSVTGGFVYRGQDYPTMTGQYLYADYCSGQFWATAPDGNGGWTTAEIGRFPGYDISTFGEDINGELYVARLTQGRIYKIKLACPTGVDVEIEADDNIITVSGDFDGYQWYLNGSPIDGATMSTFQAESSGAYYVEVFDAQGCNYFSEELSVVPSSVNQLKTIENLNISPNPFKENLTLQMNVLESTDMTLAVFDIKGIKIYEEAFTASGLVQKTMSLEDVATGVYVVRLQTAEGVLSRKVIKEK